jgi:predicted nucleotidyltransferase
MFVIAKTKFGSHLYGTSTPESDHDFRGVFLPTLRECYLNKIPEVYTDPTEEDTQLFSLHKFLNLAGTGQPIAIEMLAAEGDNLLISSPLWDYIRSNRKKFYTKKMDAFFGYSRSMAAKYAVRSERLNALEALICLIKEVYGNGDKIYEAKLSDLWQHLPLSEFLSKEKDDKGYDFYVVLNRKYRDNTPIKHFLNAMNDLAGEYGDRVKKAAANEIDWKAVAHAFRVGYQVLQIAETGDLTFPLIKADYLRDMRYGKLHFSNDGVSDALRQLVEDAEKAIAKSDLPDKFDNSIVEDILDKAYYYDTYQASQ